MGSSEYERFLPYDIFIVLQIEITVSRDCTMEISPVINSRVSLVLFQLARKTSCSPLRVFLFKGSNAASLHFALISTYFLLDMEGNSTVKVLIKYLSCNQHSAAVETPDLR